MASVFAARQQGPSGVGRLVAIKVMSAALSTDAAFRELFLREVAIATRLEHPNIARVYEVGEASGEIYLAMEFIHGASVAALFAAARNRAPVAVALRIVADAARGLHAAHELCDVNGAPLKLVHQDVSPQNLLVGYDGATRLLDFGVARIGALEASRTDSVRGKPSYLAPEQLDGGRIDRRTDVFALGVVLHELLTGKRLFQRGSVAECHAAILRGPIPDVREERPEVSAEVAGIVARALRRAPGERFATAAEMRRALADAMATPPLSVVDESVVGDWAREVVPPAFSPAELERAIVAGAGDLAADVADIADLPTEPPEKRPLAGLGANGVRTPKAGAGEPPRWRRLIPVYAAGAFVIVIAGVLYLYNGPDAPRVSDGATLKTAGFPLQSSAAPAVDSAPPGAQIQNTPPGPGQDPSPEAAPAREAPRPDDQKAPPPGLSARERPPPRPTSSAAAGEAAALGYLSVRSTPWGRVRVDGLDIGDSPIPRIPLKPGPHTISVTNHLGERSRSVFVSPGEEQRVNITF